MTLAQIIAEVYLVTNRPDLVSETASAVRKATMKFHLADTYKQDLSEVLITVPVQTDFHYQLDLSNAANYPYFRVLDHVKEYNNPIVGNEIQFTKQDAKGLLDDYGLEKQNYWYQAGFALNINSFKQLNQLTVGYFMYPNVTTGGYNSWIGTSFPDAIIDEASSHIFRLTGKDSEFKVFAAYFEQNLAMVRMLGL